MATVFKTFLNDDIATTRTLLHEAVPVSGGIVDATSYDETTAAETNIKDYTHEMFQSVYDYSYTKSSSNHIFDLSVGVNGDSAYTVTKDLDKKKIIYNEFAQILAGHDIAGAIRAFDEDGDFAAGTKINECYVISIARLLNKDEIKKGSFYIKLNVETKTNRTTDDRRRELTISDANASADYKVNSPAGDYGILKCRTLKHYTGTWSNSGVSPTTFTQSGANEAYTFLYPGEAAGSHYSTQTAAEATVGAINVNAGLIFYQAGVIILSPQIFNTYAAVDDLGLIPDNANMTNGYDTTDAPEVDNTFSLDVKEAFEQKSIPDLSSGFRKRIHQMAFNNTTELNSTIYFCRVNHNDFNYSSNPTYLDAGKIRVKQVTSDAPVSYITSVGLYSANNELLAVAKLSEPLRKDPTNEMVLRVRLDY